MASLTLNFGNNKMTVVQMKVQTNLIKYHSYHNHNPSNPIRGDEYLMVSSIVTFSMEKYKLSPKLSS